MTQPSVPSTSSSAAAVEGDDAEQLGQLVAVVAQLLDLRRVLGEDDLAAGVGDDEGHVGVEHGRVDRRRRRAGGHDGEVGEDPLHPGGRGDGDAVLEPDALGHQTRGPQVGPLAGLVPGQPFEPLAALRTRVGDEVLQRLA
jgi:hypothetical protein